MSKRYPERVKEAPSDKEILRCCLEEIDAIYDRMQSRIDELESEIQRILDK